MGTRLADKMTCQSGEGIPSMPMNKNSSPISPSVWYWLFNVVHECLHAMRSGLDAIYVGNHENDSLRLVILVVG